MSLACHTQFTLGRFENKRETVKILESKEKS